MIVAVIRARQREIGGIEVQRVLPARERRMVGPFVFLDHLGPMALPAGAGIDIPPHPHIHLATVTYLFEGSLQHRDSLGFAQEIQPGQVNWMHAGRGIVHSERTRTEERRHASSIHGLQLWVALPKEMEDTPPGFTHYAESSLPSWDERDSRGRVLVGEYQGLRSAVVTSSPAVYLDVTLDKGGTVALPRTRELALYIVSGTVSAGDTQCGAAELAIFDSPCEGSVTGLEGGARVVFIGGEPLDGERHIWWNFVSSSRERIERARADWQNHRFDPVPGDDDRAEAP